MAEFNLAQLRWVLAFAAFCCISLDAAKADSWLPPTTEVYFSANGQFRLTVTPRNIDSPLNYFQAKVEDQPLPEELGPVGILERLTDGKWKRVWSNKLVNEVSPVSALISDDGSRVITFDNWHSVGFGDHVVVVYGNDGSLVRSLALDQIVPPYFVDGFERSVSSIWWKGSDPKIVGQVLELEFPGPRKSADQKQKFKILINMADSSVLPMSEGQLALLKPDFCDAHKSAVAGSNAYLASQRRDLIAPTNDDRDEWQRYWYQAMQRLAPEDKIDDGDLFGDEVDFELLQPGAYMEKDFRDGFREALLAPAEDLHRRWFTAVDQEQMTREIEKMAKKIKAGQLAGVDMRFFADSEYWPRIRDALSASGAKLTQIDPAIPIPQKTETLKTLPANSEVDLACQHFEH